jgi:4-hydroxy-3-methylbut-2-enyl diphosphate reductase IspH
MVRGRGPRRPRRREGPGTVRAAIYVRHEIVHNKHGVQTLRDKGAVFVERTDEVSEGAMVLLSATLSDDAELVIVVGPKNSSDSVRMVEVALDAGAPTAHLVDFAHEIDEAWPASPRRA